jgi:P-type conjugative transfer protein TrbJ
MNASIIAAILLAAAGTPVRTAAIKAGPAPAIQTGSPDASNTLFRIADGAGLTGGDTSGDGVFAGLGSVAQGGCATSGAISDAMTAAGAVGSIFSGGKATAPLQVAQQIQLIAQRICQQQMLLAQLKNLMATRLDTSRDILLALLRVRSILGAYDATVYDIRRAAGVYRQQYPVDMGGMPTDEIIRQTERWRGASHDAMEESWRIQSAVVQGQTGAQARVGQQLGAVRTAPGMLAAQQGTAQLIASLIGETQAIQLVALSHYRAVEHSLAQQQAKEERAEELHRRAMQGLGENDTVTVRSPF